MGSFGGSGGGAEWWSDEGGTSSLSFALSATFSYDNEGRITGETYPTDNNGTTANLSYTFDSMGRLNTMTDNVLGHTIIAGASYGPANELTGITGAASGWSGETLTYNSLKQLTSVYSYVYPNSLWITYNYPSTGNNGKISTQTDNVSGETVTYTYDALNRLATAANQSTFSPEWGQGFSYDGFGNLTNVSVTQGSAPTLTASYNANNHAGGEDANGNPGSIYLPADSASYSATYDVENRLVATGSSSIRYSYAPGNKRVWRGVGSWNSGTGQWSPTDEVTFWSVTGQKLATYQLTTTLGVGPPSPSAPQFYATQTACNYYFGGKLIKNGNGWVYSDRLASIGKFYPYGQERPSATTNGTEKFTGYFRDSETGNDYAVNRYATPGMGRFITPDRGMGGAKPSDPVSWNKYAYVGGDPINRFDPVGREWCSVDGDGQVDTDDCVTDEVFQDPALAGNNPAAWASYCVDGVYVDDGDDGGGGGGNGGGGGGGGGSSGNSFAPQMPTLNGTTASSAWVVPLFNAAIQAVFNLLASPACDQAFKLATGEVPTSADLQTILTSATYTWGKCPQGANDYACAPASETVIIQQGGGFGDRGVTLNLPGSPKLPSNLFNEFILLHELGHLVGDTIVKKNGQQVSIDSNNYDNPFNIGILQDCLKF